MKIGLLIYQANERETNRKRSYESIRAIAQRAEADGFDSIWLPDHLLYRYPDQPTGYMGQPETMTEPLAKISAACREVGRDPASLGVTALIGLWFPDLAEESPSMFDQPLTGTVEELAAAMRGYADLGVQHIIFQIQPYTPETRKRLAEALRLYRDTN